MCRVFVIAIAAFNSLAVYFLSFLAVGGNGSSDGVVTVRWWGFGAITVTTLLALAMCSRRRFTAAIVTTSATLPTAYMLSILFLIAQGLFHTFAPAPTAFIAACKDMGARYLKAPVTPVRSIAYDWKQGDDPPLYNYFRVASNGRLSSIRGGTGPHLPAPIEFTEEKCCRYTGHPSIGAGLSYVRRPNSNARYFGVAELSADTLVTFRSMRLRLKGSAGDFTKYEIQVSDRRTGDTLATLHYMADFMQKLGCGSTSDGVMDERAFVLKAIGVQ